jgi:translation initiation factor IF-3
MVRPHPATVEVRRVVVHRLRRWRSPAFARGPGRSRPRLEQEGLRIASTTTPNEVRINERIRARDVRLVDPNGTQLGIKPLPEALALARQMDLDLVEVAPQNDPPVCRIMDYGKYKFDAAQKAKESRRKTVSVGIKEMKYRPKIGPGDFETKTRQVLKFLNEGHKVKVTIMFRGREVFHPELGKNILDRVAQEVDGAARVESEARLDGRNMVMVLAPDKRARQSAAARSQRETQHPETEHTETEHPETQGTEVSHVEATRNDQGPATVRAQEGPAQRTPATSTSDEGMSIVTPVRASAEQNGRIQDEKGS